MAAIIGNLTIFDHKVQDWQIFASRLEQFIKLNVITAERQSAVLLTHLSDESYRLLHNLVHPKKVEDLPYKELVQALNDHFKPTRSTFAEKAKFYEAVRAGSESVEEWAARLRGLAVYAGLDDALDTVLRDRFVLGFNVGPERDRLFEQNAKDLTFAKAVEVAKQAASARAARVMAAAALAPAALVKEEPVYRLSGARGRGESSGAASGSRGPEGGQRCRYCGLRNHDAEKCRYKNYTCQKCGRKGHLKKVCANYKNVHTIEVCPETEDHVECKECDLFNLRYVTYDPIKVSVIINEAVFSMELDSGSGVSVMSSKMYYEHFSHLPLKECNLNMCFYNGHKITPLGSISLQLKFNDISNDVTFFVIQNGGPPLVGRDFMSKFNFNFSRNNKINVGRRDDEVQILMNEFDDLWKDELGCFNKYEVSLQLKNDSKARFFKARSVPFALKDKVENEISRLEKLGILVPVSCSEYATPVVPVLKENGKIRIAGDFSVTLNKDLMIDAYPMPRIEEVFAKIGGGEHYSKIDLSNAYNQFRLTEASQGLTTINTSKGLYKYTRLVYGLANAPAIFQKAM